MIHPIGLDIGGANIKASDGYVARSIPFALWKTPEQLSSALQQILKTFPDRAPLAVTMTGELADCFRTKSDGVDQILTAVEQAGTERFIGVWQTGGEFISTEDARDLWPLVAAANWHALATWAARLCPTGSGVVVDIGSTTTDIIPLRDGLPDSNGFTDRERLTTGELLYAGVKRTPLSMLAQTVELNGADVGLAREVFATTGDLFLFQQLVNEDPHDCNTANGRPATREHAIDRLSRLVCSDMNELTIEEISEIVQQFSATLEDLILESLELALEDKPMPSTLLISGEGEFFVRTLLTKSPFLKNCNEVISIRKILGNQASEAACAVALSRLAAERRFHENTLYF